ncbi:MAG: hypothetical protein JW959_11650 [Pirellulales bacterium]|nr:hypothetical protein [Pirellulales bacterium]
MPSKTWTHSQQTVRPRTCGRVPLFLCVTLALLTALVVYRWGYERWLPVRAKPTFTATVHVTEQSDKAATGGRVGQSFSQTASDPGRARDAANALVEEYVANQRQDWQANMEQPLAEAHRRVEQARRRRDQSAAGLDEFKQKIQADAKAASADAPRQKTMSNPQWLELEREAAKLIERREQLLSIRTDLHPDVVEVSDRIDELERRMAAIPREISSSEEAAEKDASTTPAAEKMSRENRRKLDELAAAVAASGDALRRAEQAEQEAERRLRSPPEYAIEPAGLVENPPPFDPAWRRLLWTALAAGLTMAFGAGSLSYGASVEPPITGINEVRAATKKTVVGTIPAIEPAESKTKINRQWRVRRTMISLGLLLMAACPAVAVWGVLGIS